MKYKICFLLILLLFFSCIIQKKSSMSELFKMKIGYGDNELGYFINDNNFSDSKPININYRNGFYYIADSVNNKILKITEKGDPVLTIYNEKFNPNIKPTNMSDESNDEKVVYVKIFVGYPIQNPTFITSDIDKNIYFVNNLSLGDLSETDKTISNQKVLKFDSNGKLLFELGIEGISSKPFSYIINMECDKKNNLLVEEAIEDGIVIYKFSQDGLLISKSLITKKMIPITNPKENEYLIDNVGVILGYNEDEVYCDYQFISNEKENQYKTEYEKIYKFNLKENKFDKLLFKITPQYVELNKLGSKDQNIKDLYGDKTRIMKPLENLLGLDNFNNMYFSQKDIYISDLNKHNQILYIYNHEGRIINNIYLNFPKNIKFASDMIFSTSGKIYSYYIKDGEIHFISIL